MQSSLSFEREISIPPGLWWRQAAAAALDAEGQSPTNANETKISIRRMNFWLPWRAALFRITYYKRDSGEEAHVANIPALSTRRLISVAAPLVIAVVGIALPIMAVIVREQVATDTIVGPSDASATPLIAVGDLNQQLAAISSNLPDKVRIKQLYWDGIRWRIVAKDAAEQAAIEQALVAISPTVNWSVEAAPTKKGER